MKTGLASGGVLLAAANAIRLGTSRQSPFDLWRMADSNSGGSDSRRRELYHHAAIHAGLLLTGRGTAYRRCAVCREKLG